MKRRRKWKKRFRWHWVSVPEGERACTECRHMARVGPVWGVRVSPNRPYLATVRSGGRSSTRWVPATALSSIWAARVRTRGWWWWGRSLVVAE